MALKTDIEQLDGGRKLPLVEDFYTIQGEGSVWFCVCF